MFKNPLALLLMPVLLGVIAGSAQVNADSPRSNIVFILADDLGYGDLSDAGDEHGGGGRAGVSRGGGVWDGDNPRAGQARVSRHADQDRDGMADDWEAKRGGDLEPGGHDLYQVYDNIEVYLNELAEALVKQTEPIAAHKAVLESGRTLRRPSRGP